MVTRSEAITLRVVALWTVYIWVTRIINIVQDPAHSTQFKAVHSALAAVSILAAVAIWIVASRGRRRAKRSSP